jgi:hypothetical protein
MATNFPGSVDNFSNPNATDSLNAPSHSSQHADANDAIEAIETYVLDNPVGLVHLNTTTFSGVSTQSVNDVFSADYDNYCLVINVVSSQADEILRLRLRVAGGDAAGSNYTYQTLNAINTSVSAGRATQTSWDIFRQDTTYNGGIAYIYRPFIAAPTQYTSQNAWSLDNARISLNAGSHSLSTSYTGFSLIPNSGTITGSISTFGIRK